MEKKKIERINELKRSGMSPYAIAEEVGISVPSVYRILKEERKK